MASDGLQNGMHSKKHKACRVEINMETTLYFNHFPLLYVLDVPSSPPYCSRNSHSFSKKHDCDVEGSLGARCSSPDRKQALERAKNRPPANLILWAEVIPPVKEKNGNGKNP